MFGITVTAIIIIAFFNLNLINTQTISLCDTLNDGEGNDNSSLKLQRIRILCDAIHSSRVLADKEDSYPIPDFDLTRIDSENDANQILKRFRRGRGGGGGGRGGGGGGRSGGGSRFSSSSSSRSSGGSRIFGGSRSSSSSGGSSRIFSRSSSSSSSGGSRFFSGGSRTSSGTGHRVRAAIRSMFRKPTSSSSGISSGSSSLPGTGGSKPGLSDTIRRITHGGSSGAGGFGMGGSTGSGGNVWVRTGKTFLPQAARFGKRYYQRRKYNQGMYAGAGYYAGSRMSHQGHYYPHENYGYPPVAGNPPDQINGQTPTVFYCIQEDLNTTLVNKTLNNEGFGVCNISGKLITCPIEIECKITEADNCCEDEQGTPYCCGGPIPVEYISQYGGYGDDWGDAAESINKMLHIVTIVLIMMATICFTIWHRREQ